jgi:hypothetical protein
MLTSRYMTSVKNLSAILQKIVEGTAPSKFTAAHLKSIGFKSSNDLGVIGLLKDLGFLTPDGAPTPRYHDYRDKSRSSKIMGTALKEAYQDLFHINEKPTTADRTAIEGKFKSVHNATDRVAELQAKTFFALLKLADLDGADARIAQPKKGAGAATEDKAREEEDGHAGEGGSQKKTSGKTSVGIAGLRYNIEIHLPPTKDVEVYNAIFKSLKENLLED